MENSQLHIIKTRNNSSLFQPSSHVTIYQKGPHYFGIKVCNRLPSQIKNLSGNVKEFKTALMISCSCIHFVLQLKISITLKIQANHSTWSTYHYI